MVGAYKGFRWIGVFVAVCGACCCIPLSAFGLTDGRTYELVSPIYKGGYGANVITAVAPNGESVGFESVGVFAGAPSSLALNQYLAHRGASSWSTTPLMPPATIAPASSGYTADFSASLESSLFLTKPGPNSGVAQFEDTENIFLLHDVNTPDTEVNWAMAGPILKTLNESPLKVVYEGASEDFSHIVFVGFEGEPILPETVGAAAQTYEMLTRVEGTPALRLVGLNNKEKLIDRFCPARLGTLSDKQSKFNAVSVDGEEIFFTVSVEPGEGAKCGTVTNPSQIFVRLDGSKTLEVSKLATQTCIEVPCPGAVSRPNAIFQGASADGSRVFFTTKGVLVTGDTDKENDLYMTRIACPEGGTDTCEPAQRQVSAVVQVSHDQIAGQPAEVQGVLALTPDASRIYFVARGTLSQGPNAEGRVPIEGADNLYLYDSVSGAPPVFIADLCSGPGLSGTALDLKCPPNLHESAGQGNESAEGQVNDTKLWLATVREAQTNGNGTSLLLTSYGQLRPGDTDTAKDVYKYDATSGALERVSIGEDGYDANGNGDGYDATTPMVNFGEARISAQADMGTRAISEDGTRVTFSTAEPLSPDAVNGLPNVYEWQRAPGSTEGTVSLVSTGASIVPVEDVVLSPSGRDLFFSTSQNLLPQDTDGAPDVYDARLGGGFPPAPAPRLPCSSDACQGPLTNPAPLLVPGSVSEAPGDQVSPPVAKKLVKSKRKKKSGPKKRSKSRKKNAKVTNTRPKTSEQGRSPERTGR